MLIDTHCHLNFEGFEKDYEEVIKRCLARDMKMIVIGSQYPTSQKAIEIAEKYENIFAAVGFHPVHVQEQEFNLGEFAKLADHPKVVAIGETGLDYYHLWADSKDEEEKVKNQQKEVMFELLELSKKKRKPAILHCRDAYEDLIAALKEKNQEVKAVVHCFLGSRKIAKEFLEMGFNLGFTGILTFTDDKELFEVVKETPLERIFIETDAPYLSPEPYRGKRCEPSYVEFVAKKIAEIKNIPLEKVIEQTAKNAEEFFRI